MQTAEKRAASSGRFPTSKKALASLVMYVVRALGASETNAGDLRRAVCTICISSDQAFDTVVGD
jgi:hypothetical protein